MPITADTLQPDACYLALKARDARFDGCFFTGVTSTGIYCRPVCRVRTPKRENCRFFFHAAQAERAGFRPCLRCRPELAPHAQAWSMQDAGSILAQQAARLLDEPEAWDEGGPSVEQLAARLGVSERHVRRIFEAQFGVSPLQYVQTRRLLTAKQLLADTSLPITQVAMVSGFGSLRRFNAAFVQHYGLSPSKLRREGAAPQPQGLAVRLGFRPPYDAQAMLGFFATRAIQGMEHVEGGTFARTLSVETGGQSHQGWIEAGFDEERHQLVLRVSVELHPVLPQVIRRVRAAFDLDCDPLAVNGVLHDVFPGCEGLRVPGTFNGWELAVRAVLGQQVTVAAARTLARRVVERFGQPLDTGRTGLTRLFPTPASLAAAEGDPLGSLGIVRQRQAAIVALARAVAEQRLQLHAGADVPATLAALKELPGIGDWTAHYIAMRALRWPDAFPAGDVALQNALGVRQAKQPAREAEAASQAWKPWRSYAVIRAWAGLPAPARNKEPS
ncbi:DNA-3-methyladenine glycosylase 2 family protein [Ramlibacter humi]|uniref:DNA-3-methyladenine glycosylase II n=1 Tax=Ramlibacter humi TaxID=2530451 RepID=A0A4Z0BMV7_9BURK|nr:DNA-3-methyladenine glycosylase 2 family protein [Ramlibacter humi]TFZ00171.1 DNA-3-methyladenine glycosylase 2 family protein [Ramlibacter humi]